MFLPRQQLISVIKSFDRVWHNNHFHDWNLLTAKEMQRLFPDATIYRERALMHTKSLIAYSS